MLSVSFRSQLKIGGSTSSMDVPMMLLLLAFLSSTTKNKINPTFSNDTTNGMVIINLSLLQ
jgi:hypothetical protein